MTFCLVVVGWQCEDWVNQTLDSIAAQDNPDWRAQIVVDLSTDATGAAVEKWCATHDDPRIAHRVNTDRRYALRNQVEAIDALDPADSDVIVWLDLDGDRLAHPGVLDRVAAEYADGALLTYGSYRPVPEPPGDWPRARPFPEIVTRRNSYRRYIRARHSYFNHLRTMSGRVYHAIPPDHFRWARGPRQGDWYDGASDYVFMTAGLELAGVRHRFVEDVLLLYNHANPLADYLERPTEAGAVCDDYLARRPLRPLPEARPEVHRTRRPAPRRRARPEPVAPDPPAATPEMEATRRRHVLRDHGRQHQLRTFVETGTADGETPWVLRHDFDRLYTIDLHPGMHATAAARFAHVANVECLHGDSGLVLADALGRFDGPALVWLDGHYCGEDSAAGERNSPIREELAALWADGRPHVVLIDDARCFEGGAEHDLVAHLADWPSLDWLAAEAEAHGCSYEVADDIVRLVPT